MDRKDRRERNTKWLLNAPSEFCTLETCDATMQTPTFYIAEVGC